VKREDAARIKAFGYGFPYHVGEINAKIWLLLLHNWNNRCAILPQKK
jgi:hypothetical protein